MLQRNPREIASELSVQCLGMLTSHMGGLFSITSRSQDNAGIDASMVFKGSISEKEGSLQYIEFKAQVKSTYSLDIPEKGDEFSYSMDVQQYNKYVEFTEALEECDNLHFLLVLFVLPHEDELDDWLKLTPEQIVLKRCMYWTILDKQTHSENCSSQSVRFRKEHILTHETLMNQLILPIAEGRFDA